MTELTFPIPAELVEAIAERVAELVVEQLPAPAAGEPWQLLSVEDVAGRLGRSPRWVRDHRDAIGWVRLDGGPLAFELEDVQRFARERRIAGAPLAPMEKALHLADFPRPSRRAMPNAGNTSAEVG